MEEQKNADYGRRKKLRMECTCELNTNLSFDLNKSIYTDPSLLADKLQLFKVLIAVNAILQTITGSGHFIVNQPVRSEFATQAILRVLKAPYARYSSAVNEMALTTNPVSLTSLSKFGMYPT